MTLYEAQKTMRKHRGHGLIKCRLCEYSAIYETNLSHHMEKYHAGGLPDGVKSPTTPRTGLSATPTAKYKTRLLHGMGVRPEHSCNVLGFPETPMFGSCGSPKHPAIVRDTGFWSRSEGHVTATQNQVETIDYLIYRTPKVDTRVTYPKMLRQYDAEATVDLNKPDWVSPLEDDYNNRNNFHYNPIYHNYNKFDNIRSSHSCSKPIKKSKRGSFSTPTPKRSIPSGVEHHLFDAPDAPSLFI
eukprot:TRINITY_DN36929_c0_g1_i1.p1 TRINITY_DN36929_c0_g1~~TRINITY_DN36929_c0_g1_i1.p1  ORF type:complete len:242 (+),score=11.24 TRINITY_DN36929_c0_g1_i1:53-778(+)